MGDIRMPKKAIIHIDGDSFFASCEQALNPELKGKPVVTGKERGIVSAASYEAKAYGIKRGVPLGEVRALCPQVIVVPSDYESYSLFSKRMFSIIRRFTSEVEEYGIDEGFADITGLRRPLNMSYPKIAHTIKESIEQELNIPISLGLATSKALAKLGSKFDKPRGFVVIPKQDRMRFLEQTPAGDIWGIGPQTSAYLKKYGIRTAAQFAQQQERWIDHHLSKPHKELWLELNGEQVWRVASGERDPYKSISKTKTFTPPSTNKEYVHAQLTKNIENACIKLRRHQLVAEHVLIFLKQQNFRSRALDIKLSRATAFPEDILRITAPLFEELFQEGVQYRATGVRVSTLHSRDQLQLNLFETPVKVDKLERIYDSVDVLAKRFGKHTVRTASSMRIPRAPDQRMQQRVQTRKNTHTARQVHERQYLNIPIIGSAT